MLDGEGCLSGQLESPTPKFTQRAGHASLFLIETRPQLGIDLYLVNTKYLAEVS